MQTTLLGLAIAFIIALLAALIGPYFVDWNQFRPQFEAEAGRIIGVPVRVAGELDARLLPAPTLRLRAVTFGGNNDLGRLRADKLDVEFSLSSLMRGEWRATELSVNGMAVDLGLDARGRVDLPSTASGSFNLASLAIERLNLTGRIALHDAASRFDAGAERHRLLRRRALAGRLGPRRRQFHRRRGRAIRSASPPARAPTATPPVSTSTSIPASAPSWPISKACSPSTTACRNSTAH